MFGVMARKTVIAGIGILGAATTLFFLIRYHRYINVALEAMGRSLLFSFVLVSSALAGTHLFFDGQLLMFVDRMAIISDLIFYAFAVGFCFAPLSIYRALNRAITRSEREKAKAANAVETAPLEQRIEKRSGWWASAWERGANRVKGGAGLVQRVVGYAGETKPAAIALRALRIAAPKELPERLGKQVKYVATAPAALLVLVATVSYLGPTYGVVFLVLALAVVAFARNWSIATRGIIVSACGIVFGLVHGLHISEVAPRANVHLTSHAEVVQGTLLMNAESGTILITSDKRLAKLPWSLIRKIEIAPGLSLSSRIAQLELRGKRAAEILRETASALGAEKNDLLR